MQLEGLITISNLYLITVPANKVAKCNTQSNTKCPTRWYSVTHSPIQNVYKVTHSPFLADFAAREA